MTTCNLCAPFFDHSLGFLAMQHSTTKNLTASALKGCSGCDSVLKSFRSEISRKEPSLKMATSKKGSSKKGASEAPPSKPARKPRGESARAVLGAALAVLYRAVSEMFGDPLNEQTQAHLSNVHSGTHAILVAQGFANYKSKEDLEGEIIKQMDAIKLDGLDATARLAAIEKLDALGKDLKKLQKKKA